MIDQNHAHHLGGEGVKVTAILPAGLFLVQQSQVELMHQHSSLQNARIALPAHIGRGNLAQVGINQRH
jgi:hypothetical protein